ncbi:MAG: hypothetical protein BWY11_02306 [Firmicutes bacterium ADurb.Bin182]|nr:MAG: hypothetical protein BWY11_02306 [Firmicutes bacterium ADurb.Bin182]
MLKRLRISKYDTLRVVTFEIKFIFFAHFNGYRKYI